MLSIFRSLSLTHMNVVSYGWRYCQAERMGNHRNALKERKRKKSNQTERPCKLKCNLKFVFLSKHPKRFYICVSTSIFFSNFGFAPRTVRVCISLSFSSFSLIVSFFFYAIGACVVCNATGISHTFSIHPNKRVTWKYFIVLFFCVCEHFTTSHSLMNCDCNLVFIWIFSSSSLVFCMCDGLIQNLRRPVSFHVCEPDNKRVDDKMWVKISRLTTKFQRANDACTGWMSKESICIQA